MKLGQILWEKRKFGLRTAILSFLLLMLIPFAAHNWSDFWAYFFPHKLITVSGTVLLLWLFYTIKRHKKQKEAEEQQIAEESKCSK